MMTEAKKVTTDEKRVLRGR